MPDLGFEEPGAAYASGSQRARVFTESWVAAWLFCPNCGAARIARYPNNSPVADFYCAACREQFELKSKNGRMGPTVADGAYGAKMARLASDTNPNLALMSYDLARFAVTDLFFVPKHFFTPAINQQRPPLAPTARRAGWVGSNILLREVPESGKVWFVRGGAALAKAEVLEQWRSTCPPLTLRAFVAGNAKSLAFPRRAAHADRSSLLRDAGAAARGWLIEVMKCVEAIGRPAFTLDDVYAHEARLSVLYPGNHNVRPKIRQQLQVLRDRGWLEFMGRGRYLVRAGVG
jgi:type II restriction enzyme